VGKLSPQLPQQQGLPVRAPRLGSVQGYCCCWWCAPGFLLLAARRVRLRSEQRAWCLRLRQPQQHQQQQKGFWLLGVLGQQGVRHQPQVLPPAQPKGVRMALSEDLFSEFSSTPSPAPEVPEAGSLSSSSEPSGPPASTAPTPAQAPAASVSAGAPAHFFGWCCRPDAPGAATGVPVDQTLEDDGDDLRISCPVAPHHPPTACPWAHRCTRRRCTLAGEWHAWGSSGGCLGRWYPPWGWGTWGGFMASLGAPGAASGVPGPGSGAPQAPEADFGTTTSGTSTGTAAPAAAAPGNTASPVMQGPAQGQLNLSSFGGTPGAGAGGQVGGRPQWDNTTRTAQWIPSLRVCTSGTLQKVPRGGPRVLGRSRCP